MSERRTEIRSATGLLVRAADRRTSAARRLQHALAEVESLQRGLSRQEIGSYLGLKLETVSRVFRRFHRDRAAMIQRAEGG